MKIVVAADHGGFLLKEIIKKKLLQAGRDVLDVGCDSIDSVDYPDYAEKAVSSIAERRVPERDIGLWHGDRYVYCRQQTPTDQGGELF